jgi:hypothetical protein
MKKKKICIGVIIVLILFNVVCFAKAFFNRNKISIAETIGDTVFYENIIIEDLENIIVSENQIQEDEIIEICENQEENESVEIANIDNEQNTTEISNKPKTETNNKNTNTSTSTTTLTKQEQTSYAKETTTTKEQVTDTKEKIQNTNDQTTSQTESSNSSTEETTTTIEETSKPELAYKTYRIQNTEVIPEIIEILNSEIAKSEDLVEFGSKAIAGNKTDAYNKTTAFTYLFVDDINKGKVSGNYISFPQRVRNVVGAFGTYYVYAEDEYTYNGQGLNPKWSQTLIWIYHTF